jgi:hypothetical protein
MTRNKLTDLNDHLFVALERLNDEDLTGEALESEIQRSRAVASVANQIISNGNLVLGAARFNDDKMDAVRRLPKMLGGE